MALPAEPLGDTTPKEKPLAGGVTVVGDLARADEKEKLDDDPLALVVEG